MENLKSYRVTSSIYLFIVPILIFFLAFLVYSFFSEKQDGNSVLIFIPVVSIIFAATAFFLNFIDIDKTGEEISFSNFFGKNLEVTKILKIRRLPAFMRVGTMSFTIAYISFIHIKNKKRIKFVMVESKVWNLVKDIAN